MKSIFNISIHQDDNDIPLNFSLELRNWTESNITLNLDFEYPLLVSNGLTPDRLTIDYFNESIYNISDRILLDTSDFVSFRHNLPKLLPKNFNVESMTKSI